MPGRIDKSRVLPPTSPSAPNTVTSCPRAAAIHAASRPATPAPTTTTRLRCLRAAATSPLRPLRRRADCCRTTIVSMMDDRVPAHVAGDAVANVARASFATPSSGHAASAMSARPSATSSASPVLDDALGFGGLGDPPSATTGTPLNDRAKVALERQIRRARHVRHRARCQSSVCACVPCAKQT